MRRETVFGREMELAGSPLTLLYFQQEFGDDPLACYGALQDSIGELWIPVDDDDAPPADAADGGDEGGFVPNLLLFLKVCWAMAKTVDPKTQYFERWLSEFDEEKFDLSEGVEAALVIHRAVQAEIFRSEKAKETGA